MYLHPTKHTTMSDVAFITPTSKHFFGHTLGLEGKAEVWKWSAKKIPYHPSQTNLSPPALSLSLHPAVNLVRMETLPTQLWTCDRRSANSSFELKLRDQHRQKEKQGSHEVNVLLYQGRLSHTSWVHDLWMVGISSSGCSDPSLK